MSRLGMDRMIVVRSADGRHEDQHERSESSQEEARRVRTEQVRKEELPNLWWDGLDSGSRENQRQGGSKGQQSRTQTLWVCNQALQEAGSQAVFSAIRVEVFLSFLAFLESVVLQVFDSTVESRPVSAHRSRTYFKCRFCKGRGRGLDGVGDGWTVVLDCDVFVHVCQSCQLLYLTLEDV